MVEIRGGGTLFLPDKTQHGRHDARRNLKFCVSGHERYRPGSGAATLPDTEQKTVAVTLPDDEHGRAAEQVIRRVMEFLPQLIRERQQETLNKLTDAFLVSVTPPKRLANRLVRNAKPRQRRQTAR